MLSRTELRHMTEGSTANVSASERLDYWHDLFGSVWGEVEITPNKSSEFYGHLVSQRFGRLSVNQIEFGSQNFHRSQKQVRAVDIPFYSFAFPVQGGADCQIGDKRMKLHAGSAYLLNNNLPSRLNVNHVYKTNNIQIPVNDLESRVGSTVKLREFPNQNHTAVSFMLRQLMDNLLHGDAQVTPLESHFLNEKILDSIAFFLLSGEQESSETMAVSAHMDHIQAFIEQHYWREELSPTTIAHGCHISVSYLHRLFKTSDRSIMKTVRDFRLHKAGQMLRSMKFRHLGIGDIAYYCGFRSHAEFSKGFLQYFGMTPSKYR